MKKILILFSIFVLGACSSKTVQEKKADSSDKTKAAGTASQGNSEGAASSTPAVAEAPAVHETETTEEPARPAALAQPSQYTALNEAIKSQSDEKIYLAATQILAQFSNDAKALNALAMYHYKRSRFVLARYFISKAISTNAKMAELYSNLGVIQLAQNEKREAIKSFRKALDVNSEEAVAAANLGSIYVQEKDFGKAQIVLETAYRRGVRDPRVLNNYAIALTANHKYDKAEDLYKMVLKDSANNKESLYNYAILLVDNMAKYEQGLEVINRLKFVGGPADTRNRIIALENKAKAGLK
ncbi:MAG: tetratricopeptide repeat protein [Pseudobdellovibrionaceae bacterium]